MDSEQRKADPFHLQTIDIPTEFRAQLVQAKPPVIPAERLLDTSPPNAGITRPGSDDDEKQFDPMRLQSIEIPGEFRKQLVHAKPPVIPRERLLDTSAPGEIEWKGGAPGAEESGERRRELAAPQSETQPEWQRQVVRFGVLFLIGAAVVGVFVWWSRSTRSTPSGPEATSSAIAATTETAATVPPVHTEQAPATAAPLATTAETPQHEVAPAASPAPTSSAASKSAHAPPVASARTVPSAASPSSHAKPSGPGRVW